jgi:hypothetical protein
MFLLAPLRLLRAQPPIAIRTPARTLEEPRAGDKRARRGAQRREPHQFAAPRFPLAARSPSASICRDCDIEIEDSGTRSVLESNKSTAVGGLLVTLASSDAPTISPNVKQGPRSTVRTALKFWPQWRTSGASVAHM